MHIEKECAVFFNRLKMKYAYLNDYFQFRLKEQRAFYFFIDLNYLIRHFMRESGYGQRVGRLKGGLAQNFIVGTLNLIAHYKNYFYKHMDSMSYFYLGFNISEWPDCKSIKALMQTFTKFVNMIPRVNIFLANSNIQKFYLRYNLINIILRSRQKGPRLIFMNLGYPQRSEMLFSLTKDLHFIEFEPHYGTYIHGFNEFREDFLTNVPDKHINSVLQLMPVYAALADLQIHGPKRIDKVIMDFILRHEDQNIDYSDIETQILVIKMFTSRRKTIKFLQRILDDLNNPIYRETMVAILNSWKHHIKDVEILKINKKFGVPDKHRIQIEVLMNY